MLTDFKLNHVVPSLYCGTRASLPRTPTVLFAETEHLKKEPLMLLGHFMVNLVCAAVSLKALEVKE